jgi:hypothetical protein
VVALHGKVLAAAFGFRDEAHMVNDVRRLADASPHELLSAAG